MNDQSGKVLVVESDEGLTATLLGILNGAGYEASSDYQGGMTAVLAFDPDVVILGADPPELDCCNLLSEIKGSSQTRGIRVLMLAHGGSAERTRGLDLGADDALSLPLDRGELLARLRSQLRSQQHADQLAERIAGIEDSRNASEQVVAMVQEERRTIVAGAIAVILVLAIAGVLALSLYHRGHAENVRVYAAITRLQTGVLSQQSLFDRARQSVTANTSGAAGAPSPRAGAPANGSPTAGGGADAAALKSQIANVEGRLDKLENAGREAQTIIGAYEPSVCLIHVVLRFRDQASRQILHYAEMTSSGEPAADEAGNPLLSLTGSGPEAQVDVFGTGFLASADGRILTNHHVAEPWWQNDDLKQMADQGLEPEIAEMTGYFPSVTHGIPLTTKTISSAADVAVLEGNVAGLGVRPLALAAGRGAAVGGSPVVLLGYPTGVDAILARAGDATLQSIAASAKGDPKQVMEELARHHLISPIATQGHIGEVLPDKIVYDAQTTSGGSGGPLFDDQGRVIGINFAMVRDFGGSNFAIPIRYAEALFRP